MKKIVVIGPESTGKSTLCRKLAGHYQTAWVPEYAREYLEKKNTGYGYEDLLTIAKGQIALEEAAGGERGNNGYDSPGSRSPKKAGTGDPRPPGTPGSFPLFIDTDMYVMKVWAEFVFNDCHHWILNRIAERKYDLYLLCDIDLPWAADPLREYPDKKVRERLFCHYKDLMVSQDTPWCVISGNYEERLRKATDFVDPYLTRRISPI